MESYNDFLNRINQFETGEVFYGNDYFNPNPSVHQKVNPDNTFKAFFGDTIVFNLNASFKKKLEKIAADIFNEAPECFCEKLVPQTFHVTLHDLSNSPELYHIAPEVFENELKVISKLNEIQPAAIRMKTKCIFNMVGTSLVLGLYPANEEEYNKLMTLYCTFDDVKHLSYPLTPHITLGYYNFHGFSSDSARKLENIVRELNKNETELELSTNNLYYQKFTSMNNYINIINIGRGIK